MFKHTRGLFTRTRNMRYNNQSMATSSFMTDATLEDKPASSADRIPAAESAADPETTGQGRKKALSPEDA